MIRLTLGLGLPALVLLEFWLMQSSPGVTTLYFSLVIAAALGVYGPTLFVRAKADRRQQEIINGFPDALDLMLVCVEAGLGLEAAFARVGMEITESHPRIAEQFGYVVLEMRAGRNREDALRRMADRAGADEIRAFATLLIQSTKLGSSIAQTLRIYASEMRERRRLQGGREGPPPARAAVHSLGDLHAAGDDRCADAARIDPCHSGGRSGSEG